ncbi:MAG: T9SS type A sorting domain-containing protein [Chitinophagales bacterium]|nr:T9SS type A sorting domain-containing protein [Chitinophagales bacterium]
MKCYLTLCVLFFLSMNATSQKQGNIWVGGFKGEITFLNTAESSSRADSQLFWRTSASICDSEGKLLFYTNGFRVFNQLGEIMQNGDSLALGDYISYGYGFNATPDGAVILPLPSNDSNYYLFYNDLNYINTELGNILYPTHLYYAKISFGKNYGLGTILNGEKQIVVLTDTLTDSGIQAVKHGNGRDWWLVCHEYGSNRYYKFLIDSSGIEGPYIQDIGIVYKLVNAQISSPMKFSADGSLFVHQSRDSNIVELMNFDRCTGNLYNYRSFQIDSVWVPARGVSISPNNQFVYVSSNFNEILQFDITKADIFNTRQIVGRDNGIEDPFPANYYLHQLGPDGKIYITPYDADYALHVINNPDLPDTACHFVEWGFPLIDSTTWFGCAPNIPNYNLGALEGSLCDTVFTSLPIVKDVVFTHGVYPNPCYQKTQLSITGVNHEVLISIYNTIGNLIYNATLQPINGFVHAFINLYDQPPGVYLLKAKTDRREVTEKILNE